MTTWTERLGTVGVWRGVTAVDAHLAKTIEDLGFGAIWQGGSPRADLRAAEELLDSSERIVVATGIVNIWRSDPAELAASYHRIAAKHPDRLLLGIGTGHREATAERVRPLAAMTAYLDALDEAGVPVDARVLSALGPKMLRLASARSVGTHPYLTVPAQTREVREQFGPGFLIAPEQTVVWDGDTASAREKARAFLRNYLRFINYVTNMRRAGFTEDDVAAPGSDRLVDAIVAHGDAAVLAAAVRTHLDAGADHVCVQIVPVADDPVPALRALATELGLS